MATPSPYPSFERIILNHGPVQESIIRNLTRWDFRNLQLAGVRIPVSQQFQKKYLKPTRCNETDPHDWDRKRCASSTATVDEIRACAGGPVWVVDNISKVTEWIGAQAIRPCLEHEMFGIQYNNADDEPNTSQYPIHSKVCKSCFEFFAARNDILLANAVSQSPLCKQHSLEQSKQSPVNACRCLDYLNGKYRCRRCQRDAFAYLCRRDIIFGSIAKPRIPWSHPFARLRRLLLPHRPVCPLNGCLRQSWLDKSRHERMQMCSGCNSITSIGVSRSENLTGAWLNWIDGAVLGALMAMLISLALTFAKKLTWGFVLWKKLLRSKVTTMMSSTV